MWPVEESWAGRLTLRSARPVGAAQSRRIRRRFEALDAHPAMPPAAMLFVRRLTMEAPAERKSGAVWDLGVRDRLASLYDNAARPDEGCADPAAEAVVFPDEATMIACLLTDMRRGWAAELWWWRSVWSRGALPRSAGAILAARPEQVPAVFRALNWMGEAVRVAALLGREQAAVVVRAMLGAHAAPTLSRVFEVARRPVDSIGPSPIADGSSVSEATAPRLVSGDAELPAGLPRQPRGTESLPPENRVLVALSLGLAATPHVVRSVEFAARAAEWLRAEFSTLSFATPRGAVIPQPAVEPDNPTAKSPLVDVEPYPVGGPERMQPPPLGVPRPNLITEPGEEDSQSPAPTMSAAVHESRLESSAEQHSDSARRAIGGELAPSPAAASQAGIRTRLGGALYLISAFERLGIPECFEPEWPLSKHFSRWGVLELVTRGLVGTAGLTAAYRDDPIWTVFAQIDGRDPRASVFQNFSAQDRFRIPSAWVAELLHPNDEFAWASKGRRIAAWSRAGWLVADRPLAKGERRDAALRRELLAQGRVTASGAENLPWAAAPHAPLGSDLQIAPTLRFWLECTLPALRVWLARTMALGQPDYAALVETLLFVPGELFVTSTRVDFVAPIDQTRIPVRRAALDLDPGWLPAWGRSIRFHYGDAHGGLR